MPFVTFARHGSATTVSALPSMAASACFDSQRTQAATLCSAQSAIVTCGCRAADSSSAPPVQSGCARTTKWSTRPAASAYHALSLSHKTRIYCNSTNKVCMSWCRYIDGDTYHCISCSRLGNWTCLRCKICFCDSHVVGKINVAKKGEAMTCKRCRFELQETKGLSISGEAANNVTP